MSALHATPVQVHGHLRSSKCLIDSRWVCKVADYGLRLLKSGQRPQENGEHAKYKSTYMNCKKEIIAVNEQPLRSCKIA